MYRYGKKIYEQRRIDGYKDMDRGKDRQILIYGQKEGWMKIKLWIEEVQMDIQIWIEGRIDGYKDVDRGKTDGYTNMDRLKTDG